MSTLNTSPGSTWSGTPSVNVVMVATLWSSHGSGPGTGEGVTSAGAASGGARSGGGGADAGQGEHSGRVQRLGVVAGHDADRLLVVVGVTLGQDLDRGGQVTGHGHAGHVHERGAPLGDAGGQDGPSTEDRDDEPGPRHVGGHEVEIG